VVLFDYVIDFEDKNTYISNECPLQHMDTQWTKAKVFNCQIIANNQLINYITNFNYSTYILNYHNTGICLQYYKL